MSIRTASCKGDLRSSALVAALALGLSASGAVFAQSTVGAVYGTADPGATIQLQNLGSGQTRTVTAGGDGRFNAGSLAPGNYRITVTEGGQTSTRNVQVVAGQGFNLNLVSSTPSGAENLEGVQVTANAMPPIDVESVETTTVFTAQQMKNLPISRNQTAVALLAPGTVQADSAFGNLAVFNGASAAENSYYVNGFNVTNQFQTLQYSQVPFEAIAQQEVKSGGYGAEYGNSTGGVISVITKRGTNTWTGGANVIWTPSSLTSRNPTKYYNDGRLFAVNDKDVSNTAQYNTWLGGPLIKDKLFIFALYRGEKQKTDNYGNYTNGATFAGGASHADDSNPFWLVKLDWNISDNHILEYTGFSDTQHSNNAIYYQAADDSQEPVRDQYQGMDQTKNGGLVNILKYTGYLTDALTLSAQYGKLTYNRYETAYPAEGGVEYYNGVIGDLDQPGCPEVRDTRDNTVYGSDSTFNSCDFLPGNLNLQNGKDKRRNWRVDLEWQVGDHDLKVGYNRDDWNTFTGSSREGGKRWIYSTQPQYAQGYAADVPVSDGSPLQSYVTQNVFQTGASVGITQKSYYLEDFWHITDNLLAYIGARNDSYENRNGNGDAYVSQNNIWQPRVGFSWDVHGDSTLKVFGSAGDYSLPIAANVALRASSASMFRAQDFLYTGVDPETGAPTGLSTPTQVYVDADGNLSATPQEGYSPFYNLTPRYVNGETGNTPDPRSVADKDLKPYKQREFILGAEQQVADWTFGVKLMYRKLLNAIDDTCDYRPIAQYAHDVLGLDVPTGPDQVVPYGDSTPGCYLFNPGSGVDLDMDVDGSGELRPIHLTATDLGVPKARRTFKSIELSAERVWDEKWYLKATYVWSKSEGNAEGLVKSDIGQTDTGTTQDFDYPEFAVGANGYLPNDRRHQLKIYGAWQITPEWLVGANALWQTGRPENCLGVNKAVDGYIQYGASYFFCNGHIVPRGTAGRTPPLWYLDASLVYQPRWAEGLRLQLDVDNIFNKHIITQVDESGETGSGASRADTLYLSPTAWQSPRQVRVTVQYDFTL